MKADLHVHTLYSDGTATPEEIVARAKFNGVEILSVTDHDNMLASEDVSRLCRTQGIIPVAGAEISAYEGSVKLHTMCYSPDTSNSLFRNFLKELCAGALTRTEHILSNLKKCGVLLTLEDIAAEQFCKSSPMHVMHVAAAGAKKGYAGNRFEFFNKYLAYGKAGFCLDCRPAPERTVEIITAAGGFASVAHPGRVEMNATDFRKLISRLKDCGLKGIEAVYSTHTYSETAYYKELAKETGLLVTGGSDTHIVSDKRDIGKPEFHPAKELLQQIVH